MKKYLINEGICEDKLVTLDIFDYLTNSSEISENKGVGLTIAGNLNKDKSGYLYKLIEQYPNYTINLYGPNFDENIDLEISLPIGNSCKNMEPRLDKEIHEKLNKL